MKSPATAQEIGRLVRASLCSHIYDETAAESAGTAIHTLADSRERRDDLDRQYPLL
jgi:hypothetical protein